METKGKILVKSIIDYIYDYGDNSIETMPLNEVDSLILCQLSYLKYDGIVPALNAKLPFMTLQEIKERENFDNLFFDRRFEENNRELFLAASESIRFKNMRLGNYVSMTDTDWELQFSAITFTFENGTFYLAYRGTDETIIGWKEDFNMALITPIPSQEKAMQYLNLIAEISHGDFYIGGHSKGGNLAVYAASKCLSQIRERIITIYNHDGPGFKKGTVTESEGFKSISGKIKKFMPHSSIIGMLMESNEPTEIIECRSFGILQHDPFNWIVDDTSFRRVDDLYTHVLIQDESVNQWINGMSDSERKIFVDNLFKVLSSGGSETLLDIMDDFITNSIAMKNAITELDPKTREMISIILNNLQFSLQEVMMDRVRKKIEPHFSAWLEKWRK